MPNLRVKRGPLVVLRGGLLLVALLLILGAGDAAAAQTCQPSDADADADGLSNSCDPAAFNPDWDGDGFEDSLEIYVGTGPGLRCSFPADLDGSGTISAGDPFVIFPYWLETPDDTQWPQRYDIDGSEQISAGDVYTIYPVWLQTCATPWFSPSTVTKELWSKISHAVEGQVWSGADATMSFESNGLPTNCNELQRAGDHWANTTDFPFSLETGQGGSCVGVVGDVMFFWRSLASPPGLTLHARVDPYVSGRECTEANPCHFFTWAAVLLNVNSPDMVNDSDFRHLVMTHELGHVVGQGHSDIEQCNQDPLTIMGSLLDCHVQRNMHRLRPSDVLFTKVKY